MVRRVEALVIGAGISGLATAFYLQEAGVATLLVEAGSRPGGVIQSVVQDGYLLELGPQSFTGTPALAALTEKLGIAEERVFANPRAPRYLLIDGALREVPLGPQILLSSFFAGGTRGALLRDLFGSSKPPETDESVAAFVRRKFSATLLERLVGPFVSGIYAGDPEKLSLRAAFPRLHQAEQEHGSVLRGMMKRSNTQKSGDAKRKREKPTLQTFREGNGTLIRALAAKLGEALRCGSEVTQLRPLDGNGEAGSARFRATLRTPRGDEFVEAARVVIATPTDVTGRVLEGLDAGFGAALGSVAYAGVAVVSLGYRVEDVGRDLAGFGFLVPRSAGLQTLGTVWNSSLFPGRAPQGHVLLTSFVGGATNPGAVGRKPEELSALVHREIAPLLGLKSAPAFSNVKGWARAIPQYNLGHAEVLRRVEELRKTFPGLYFAGNYWDGPAIGVCVERAERVAGEVRVSFVN